jgi:hypothetical protein
MFCNIFVTISTESSPFSKPSANPRCFFCGDLERRHFTIIYISRCYRILIALLHPFIRGLSTQVTRQKADNQTDRQYLPFQVSAKTGFTSKNWQLTQCLFGEHLIRQYPDTTVALIESEKTAIGSSSLQNLEIKSVYKRNKPRLYYINR